MSDSLQPHGLQPAKLLCPWDFPRKNTGMRCHVILQVIFTQVSNPYLMNFLRWQVDFYHAPPGKPHSLWCATSTFIEGTWALWILIFTGVLGINPAQIPREKCIQKLQETSQGAGRESGEEKNLSCSLSDPRGFISYGLGAWLSKLSNLKNNNTQVVLSRRVSPPRIFI